MLKKILLFLIIIIIFFTGVAFTNNIESHYDKDNLRAYFPTQLGRVYEYVGKGEGMGYNAFTRKIMYVKAPYLQLHDMNGTTMARIYKIEAEQITLLSSRPEFYEDRSLLENLNNDSEIQEIVLKAPLKRGASWKSNGGIKEVYAVDMVVEVPAGIFYDVIIIKSSYSNQTINFSCYAKNIGLIKSLSIISKGSYSIISVLETFSQSKPGKEEGENYEK